VRQTVNLLFEQPVEGIEAARIAWLAVVQIQRPLDQRLRPRRCLNVLVQSFGEGTHGAPPLPNQFTIARIVRRQAAQPGKHVTHFRVRDVAVEGIEDERNGLGIERQNFVQILNVKSVIAESQPDAPTLQFRAVLVAENRDEEFVL